MTNTQNNMSDNEAAKRYNDMCRFADMEGGNSFLKMNISTSPLYVFDNLLDILFETTYKGLSCDIDRTVLFSTNTRCVMVTIFHDADGSVRINRIEPGAEHPIQQVFLEGENIVVCTKGAYSYVINAAGYDTFEFSKYIYDDIPNKNDINEIRTCIINMLVVIAMLNRIDSPIHYVLAESPTRIRTAGKKTARYDDRERWIVLDRDAVIKKYKSRPHQGGTHASPSPHLRRGHYMTLSNDRYTKMKGKRIPIRPTWVGDREWHGSRGLKYRVISREGAEKNQA